MAEDAGADRPERVPRIPQAKLASVQPTPAISIFYRKDRNQAVQLLRGNFSRDAAVLFCDSIFQDLKATTSKSFIITGGDRAVFDQIFQWIDSCVAQGKLIQFEQLDDTLPYVMSHYAEIVLAAEYLGIPARDLGDGLKKRMLFLARKVLLSWDEIESIYHKFEDHEICEYAAASVFYAWWQGKLDEMPGELDFLADLRDQIPQLDFDLHEWCARNEEEVKAKWAEKKAQKEAQDVAQSEGFGEGTTAVESSSVGGGWDAGSQTVTTSGDWDSGDKIESSGWAAEGEIVATEPQAW